MKIEVAERTGFCFGVKRAVNIAEGALKKHTPICSLGSIIHNSEVVEGLSRKGLAVIKDVDDIKGGAVVVSSHGLSPRTSSEIAKKGVEIIDTTCPFVLNAQRLARSLGDEGYDVIIVGDRDHPEVKALVDFVTSRAFVVKDEEEARAIGVNPNGRLGIIFQTTQSRDNFLEVVKAILEKRPKEMRIFNTICNDTEVRQAAARALAAKVDCLLVIGGKDSANTKRLFEVCKKILRNSHHIETERDIRKNWFGRSSVVGITSGASTPDRIVQRVVDKIKTEKDKGHLLRQERS